MAISQAMCSSFKEEILEGIHDLTTDTLRMALFLDSANLGPETAVYTTTGEAVGSGYTAGGMALTGVSLMRSGGVSYLDFNDVIWPSSTITARGALIYNSSKTNRAIAVYDFGSNVTTSTANFVVQPPAPNPTSAVIRLT